MQKSQLAPLAVSALLSATHSIRRWCRAWRPENKPLRADAKTAVIPMALLCALLLAQTALAVPSGVPKDPPAPRPAWAGCSARKPGWRSITVRSPHKRPATPWSVFSSTYPYRFRRFQRSDSTWTSWTALPTGATSWDCQGTCFHDTARVEIRGCENSTCATGATSECAILIGVPHNGPARTGLVGHRDDLSGRVGLRAVRSHRNRGAPALCGGASFVGLSADRRAAGNRARLPDARMPGASAIASMPRRPAGPLLTLRVAAGRRPFRLIAQAAAMRRWS